MDTVFVAQPGRIISFDASTSSAEVQPLLKFGYVDEVGDRQSEDLPPLPSVPCLFVGGGGFSLDFPVAAGDLCLLVHSSSSIQAWKTGSGDPLDSGDDRKHHLADAIAIVGLRTFQGTRRSPTDGPTLGSSSGPVVQVTSSEVRLGGEDASDPIVRKSDLQAVVDKLNDFIAKYNGHGHNYVPGTLASIPTSVPVVQLAPTTPATELTALPATGSDIVKGK